METKRATIFDRSFWRIMMPLAFPIAMQNLLMTSFRLVDTLMIGRLGDVSLAAVGLAGYVSFFVELLAFGMASGSAVFIAQYHGAKNKDGMLRSFGAMLLFVIPIGLLFAFLAGVFPEAPMHIFTDDPVLIKEGARYLKYACLSYLSVVLNLAISTLLRCAEKVRIPMWTSGICALLNAILNYVFIFGAFGRPGMGVAGAGLATAISSLLNPVLMLVISAKEKNILWSPLKVIFNVKGFLGTYWKRVLPVVFNEMIWSLSIIGMNMVFGRMGTDNFAALTVVRTIENIVFVFFVGICNACNVLVGKSIGAGDIDQGKRYAKQFIQLVPLLGIALGAMVYFGRDILLSVFDISAAANHTAGLLLLIYAVDVTVRNIPYLQVVGIFRAGGDTKIGLLGDAVAQYLLVLPAVIICGLVLKMSFVATYFIMICVDDVSKLIIYMPYFFKMRWIKPVSQDALQSNVE